MAKLFLVSEKVGRPCRQHATNNYRRHQLRQQLRSNRTGHPMNRSRTADARLTQRDDRREGNHLVTIQCTFPPVSRKRDRSSGKTAKVIMVYNSNHARGIMDMEDAQGPHVTPEVFDQSTFSMSILLLWSWAHPRAFLWSCPMTM